MDHGTSEMADLRASLERARREALRDMRDAANQYGELAEKVSADQLGEGEGESGWLRLRRSLDEYDRARSQYLRDVVLDQ